MENYPTGASITARPVLPCINLLPIVKMISDAITSSRSEPIFVIAGKKIIIDLGMVMRGFSKSPVAKQLGNLKSTESFLRDIDLPQKLQEYWIKGNRIWLGGRILEGSERDLSKAYNELVTKINNEIEQAIIGQGGDLSNLIIHSGPELCVEMSRRLKNIRSAINFGMKLKTRLAPVTFENEDKKTKNIASIARVFTSIETIHGNRRNHLESLIRAVQTQLSQREIIEEAEIPAVLDHLRVIGMESGGQLDRFFDFLESESLPRMRLQVGMQLMAAIADDLNNKNNLDADEIILRDYVQRIRYLIDYLQQASSEDISVRLAYDFGTGGDFLFNEEIKKSTFYNYLPVWCEWQGQLFEDEQCVSEDKINIIREVSYRFRTNGNNPEYSKPAFQVRLRRLEENLLNEKKSDARVTMDLAKLILFAVIFRAEVGCESVEKEGAKISEIVKWLNNKGRENVKSALERLNKLQDTPNKIARSLVRVLKNPGRNFMQIIENHRNATYYINIMPELIDWEQVISCGSLVLKIPADQNEQGVFFRNVVVTKTHPQQFNLFSVQVDVNLTERAVYKADVAQPLRVERAIPQWIAPIIMLQQDMSNRISWTFPSGIEIRYDPDRLQLSKSGKNLEPEYAWRSLAAYRTGFAILAYVVLSCLLRRAAQRLESPPTVWILRIQPEGRTPEEGSHQAQPTNATTSVYAISQGIETVLARDFPLRVQGFVEPGDSYTQKYRRRNAFAALQAAFPLKIETPQVPQLSPIGVITLATRRCDAVPGVHSSDDEGHLFITRSYRLESITAPFTGFRVQVARNNCQVAFGQNTRTQPPLIAEEIKYLYEQGCRHILYIAHRFGERRLGRTLERWRFHENPNFLESIYQRFPGLILYPLRRDVFPAIRIRSKGVDEDGYEVIDATGHGFKERQNSEGSFYPIYSLATLKIAGKNEEERPQSGFSSYFLLDSKGSNPIYATRTRSNLLIPESEVRPDLLTALRAIHYLESEKYPEKDCAAPILDPYGWMHPITIGGAGDLEIAPSVRSKSGSIMLNIPAVLERISAIR